MELRPARADLFDAWRLMSNRRPASPNSIPSPISFGQMEEWARVHGLRLTPWEFDTIAAIDDAYRAKVAGRMERKHKREGKGKKA